jgi:hypothetical protein
MLGGDAAKVTAFADARGWSIDGGVVRFPKQGGAKDKTEIPAMRVITDSLKYATELERIV